MQLLEPKISIYIPTCNRADLLLRSVQSIQRQSFQNLEIVICDDCSSDNTRDIVNSLQIGDDRIKYVRNEVQAGACATRNRAIAACTGEYITGCDDDDYFEKDRLRQLLEFEEGLTRASVSHSFIYSNFVTVTKKGESLRKLPQTSNLGEVLKRNCIGSQIFARRQLFQGSEKFDEKLPAWQDHDLWIRLIKHNGPAYNCGGATYFVDTTHNSPRISGQGAARIQSAFESIAAKHEDILSAASRNRLKANAFLYKGFPMSFRDVIVGYRDGFGLLATYIFFRKTFTEVF